MHKGAKVAGLILIGGSDSVLNGVYVKKLIPDSPAHKDGRLRPADRILRINSVSMERASHNAALQALQRSSSLLRLTVYRDPELGQSLIKADPGTLCVCGECNHTEPNIHTAFPQIDCPQSISFSL